MQGVNLLMPDMGETLNGDNMRIEEIIQPVNKKETERLFTEYFDLSPECTIKVNDNGSVDVDGSCWIKEIKRHIKKLPIKFNEVSRNFNCDNGNLTTLAGSPKIIGGSFTCTGNKVHSLFGGPDYVNGHYICSNVPLQSLDGFPIKLGGKFECDWYLDLPLLKTLMAGDGVTIYIKGGIVHPITKILNSCKEKNPDSWRKAVVDAKFALITAGFEGNAKW
jgi:hypothetical protein